MTKLTWYADDQGFKGPMASENAVKLYDLTERQRHLLLIDYIYNFERLQKNVEELEGKVHALTEQQDAADTVEDVYDHGAAPFWD